MLSRRRLHGNETARRAPSSFQSQLKKLRCSHFPDQSPTEIKQQRCCMFKKKKKDHPTLLFPQTFILTLPPSVFFFRNSEEHPSKFSNRPIFKFVFFSCCPRKSVSEQVFQRHPQFMAHNRVKTSVLFHQRVLSYFLSVADYPQALGLKKF